MGESTFSLLECGIGILSVGFVKSGGSETSLVNKDTSHAEHWRVYDIHVKRKNRTGLYCTGFGELGADLIRKRTGRWGREKWRTTRNIMKTRKGTTTRKGMTTGIWYTNKIRNSRSREFIWSLSMRCLTWSVGSSMKWYQNNSSLSV